MDIILLNEKRKLSLCLKSKLTASMTSTYSSRVSTQDCKIIRHPITSWSHGPCMHLCIVQCGCVVFGATGPLALAWQPACQLVVEQCLPVRVGMMPQSVTPVVTSRRKRLLLVLPLR